MEELKPSLKQSLRNLILNWPLYMVMLVILYGRQLYQHFGVPIWLTNSAAFLILFGIIVFHWHKGAGERRKIAKDRRAFADKVAAAEAQLFGR